MATKKTIKKIINKKPTKKKPIKRKIWFKKKTVEINPLVENYNAGEDILYDQLMIPNDVFGTPVFLFTGFNSRRRR